MPLNFEIPLQPKQIELHELFENSRATIIGDGGSKGSAKSYGGRAIMLLRRLKYRSTACLLMRRKWKQHREQTLESGYFKDFPALREYWQESKRAFHLPNNSRIVLGIAEHASDIDDFQGQEYMDVLVDEAARFSETELIKLNETRRWTGKFGGAPIPDWLCKTCWLMNPGGPGHSYIRRVMFKREYHNNEQASNYVFLQSRAWDNIEWSRTALSERFAVVDCNGAKCNSCGACWYYKQLSETERFKFFIEHTQRGRELNALPKRLRSGWLLGDWNEFAGQFFDIWDEDRFVKRCQPDRDWHPRWLGIDWGFQHPLSCHWLARVGVKTRIYREHHNNLHSARAQAQEIVDMTPESERKLIDAIYLSPDAFQKRSEQDSFADQMSEVFERYGMPSPQPADDDRKHGAQALYELMKADEIEIDVSCKHLREVIPMICTEEDDPEEIEKFEGDDAFDSARYGIKSRMRAGLMPVIERVEQRVTSYLADKGKKLDEIDCDTAARLIRRATFLEKKSRSRRQRRSGRVWHPQLGGA